MRMSEIDQLLKADEENAEKTRRFFLEFDNELLDAFDEGNNIVQTFMRSFGQNATDDIDQTAITEISKKSGLNEKELAAIIRGEKKDSSYIGLTKDLDQIQAQYYCRRARALLTLQIFRSFMFAGTDIRRMQVVRAFGQLRPAIEATALITIFQSENKLAVDWYNIRDDIGGKAFFRETINRINKFCKTYDVENEWNLSSAAAQHSRLIGLVDGLKVNQYVNGIRRTQEYKLSLQDFNPERPAEFISRALYILRVQAKLLLPLEIALPEASDPLLRETRIPNFRNKIERLYKVFEVKFSDYLSELGFGLKKTV